MPINDTDRSERGLTHFVPLLVFLQRVRPPQSGGFVLLEDEEGSRQRSVGLRRCLLHVGQGVDVWFRPLVAKRLKEEGIGYRVSWRCGGLLQRAAFAWLVDVRYLAGNPWNAVNDPRVVRREAGIHIDRALPGDLGARPGVHGRGIQTARRKAVAHRSRPAPADGDSGLDGKRPPAQCVPGWRFHRTAHVCIRSGN